MQDVMGPMDIAFPHLGIYLRNVPQSFSIFGFQIALYGVIVASAFLISLLIAAEVAKRTRQDPDVYWDIALYVIIMSIVGARIFYVMFMWDYYAANPIQIFNLRGGGLAIWGGVIAGVLTIAVYCKIKNLNPLILLDTIGCGLVMGQVIGRWGNFFNREVFGGYTDSLLAMRLPLAAVRARDVTEELASHVAEGTNYIQVHPTFLYEGIWNLCLFGLLLLCWKKKKFHGEVILLYFTGYGIGRAWIEMIRTDQLYLPGTQFPVCFLVSIAAILVSAVTEFVIRRGLKEGRYQDLLWDPAGVSAIGAAGSAEDAAGTAAEDTSETPAEASGSAQEQN